MKLFNFAAITALVAGEWQQPTYWDAINAVRKRQRSSGWGHPVGIKAAALWSNCPALALPAGVKEIKCDGSTCMQVCEDGKASVGKRRTKCRWKRNVGFFWKKQLAECKGCDPEIPVANDANVVFTCALNTKNIRKCTARCADGSTILGKFKYAVRCRCPRTPQGDRMCGWYKGQAMVASTFIQGLTCAGTAAAPATAAPTAAPTVAVTTAAAGATTAAAGATTAAAGATTAAAGATTAAAGATTAAAGATTAAAGATTAAAGATTAAAGATTAAAGATTAAAGATTAAAGATTAAAGATTAAAGATTAAAGAGATAAAGATTAPMGK